MRAFGRSSLVVAALATTVLALTACPGAGGDEPPRPKHAIAGRVSGDVSAGVTVALTGAASASTTTDGSGNYAFSSLADGEYTVTPSFAGHAFSPASIAVSLVGADATGQDFVSSAPCPAPNAYVDRAGFVLYDRLCDPALDGSRWQIPGGFARQVTGGVASLRVAVANEEPRALRNSVYASYAAVASGLRVTTLRTDVEVPAATAFRAGGADIRAAVRLIYQPPSERLNFPSGYADLLVVEVGLLDAGDGLHAYRQVVHCDDPGCSAVSPAGVAFEDPDGFASLGGGLQAGTPAAYDTSYTVQASLDETTGVFGWTIAGGAFGAGISGSADPTTYLASAPGWSGIPLAGSGFFHAQLGVSTRDTSTTGGGQGDVTGLFDDVWVGLSNNPPDPWDDFSGTGANSGSGGFSPLKWAAPGNQSALPAGGSFAQHVDLSSDAGTYFPAVATNTAFPPDVDAMLVDVFVPTYPGGQDPSVFLQGRFYNDGTAGAAPYSAIGDVQGQIRLEPQTENARFLVFKCLTVNCSSTTILGSGSFAGHFSADFHHTLRLGFDPVTKLFTFGVDAMTVVVDPQVTGQYMMTPAPWVSPANSPLRLMGSATGVQQPTATSASLDARFNHVYVWRASAPVSNHLQ